MGEAKRRGAAASRTRDVRPCLVPNPYCPVEKCLISRHVEHEHHSWWYCSDESAGGEPGSVDCELQRGHEGDHMGHWPQVGDC